MLTNLALGTLLIAVTVVTHTFGLIALSGSMTRVITWFRLHRHDFGRTVAMVAIVLGLFLLHTVEIWLWAAMFVVTHAIGQFQDALYFSTVTFATVGSGDVTVTSSWRLLASLEAIDGFMLIGWSIAYLVAASTRYGPFRAGEHF